MYRQEQKETIVSKAGEMFSYGGESAKDEEEQEEETNPAEETWQEQFSEKDGNAGNVPSHRGNHPFFIAVMGIFVIFSIIWGTYQSIQNIDTTGRAEGTQAQQAKKTENNTEKEGASIDTDTLAKKLLDEINFDTKLKKLDESVAKGIVTSTEGTTLQIYMGNGTFADELLVMTARSEKDAKKNIEYAADHLKETQAAFEDYLPKEAEKINKAVTAQSGCYVVVCVTSDYETAEKAIASFMEK